MKFLLFATLLEKTSLHFLPVHIFFGLGQLSCGIIICSHNAAIKTKNTHSVLSGWLAAI